MRIDSALAGARRRLAAAGVESAGLDARVLASEAFAMTPARLIADGDQPVDPTALAVFEALVARRAAGEPVGRILGRREFHGLDLTLSVDTLEPRPDTETLIEVVLSAIRGGSIHGAGPDGEGLLFADLGTGTGAIAIALAVALPAARGIATDIAPGALATAKANAARHGVDGRISFRLGDWLEPLDGPCMLVVSNPPYIPTGDLAGLDREVRDHDPVRALDGGRDGLDAYRVIVAGIADRLEPGGLLAVEIGSRQGPQVVALVANAGLDAVTVHRDLAGHDRVVVARRTGRSVRVDG
jgi:release factor glutamine methyltransferase